MMRAERIWFAAALACAASACGAASRAPAAPQPPPTPEAVVVQVTGTIEQWRQGYELRNVEALGPLYDPQLTWIMQGRKLHGWPEVKDALGAFFATHPQVKLLVADLVVVALGSDGAAATAAVSRRYGNGVTTVEEVGAAIWALRRTDSGWLIVAEQFGYAGPQ